MVQLRVRLRRRSGPNREPELRDPLVEPVRRSSTGPGQGRTPRKRSRGSRSLLYRALRQIHLWLGLSAGLLIVVLGLTGSVLVYGDELDGLLRPDLHRVSAPTDGERLPPAEVLALARGRMDEGDPPAAADRSRAGSSSRFRLVEMPTAPDRPYVLWRGTGAESSKVYVHPYSGRVLGSRPDGAGVVATIHRIHTTLLAGETGGLVVGWLGVGLLVLAVTGLFLWWPRLRSLLDAITVRWSGSGRRVNYDLHRAGGFWTLPYLVVVAATGAGLIFYTQTGALLEEMPGTRLPPPPPVSDTTAAPDGPASAPLAPARLARAHELARQVLGSGRITFIYLPARPEDPVTFRARLREELHPNGRSFAYVDRWTGELLRVDDARDAGPGAAVLYGLYPVHIGRFELGVVSAGVMEALYALLGLAPAVLFVTGAIIWWKRGNGRSRA